MSSSSTRMFGIEAAYTFALIGCVMYIFLFTIGDRVLSILSHQEFSILLDIFPAVFFFLNGMTVTLTMRDKRISRRKLLDYQGKRGSVLCLIGLATCIVWPMNMFFLIGLMYFLSRFLALWSDLFLRILLLLMAALGVMLLYIGVPMSVLYVPPTLQGGNMINFSGFVFFNGYFSIIPWSIFFIAGMLFGRLNIKSKGLLPPSSILGIVLIIASFIIELYSKPMQELLFITDYQDSIFFKLRLFFLPFVFFGIGFILLTVNLFIYFFNSIQSKYFIKLVQTISSMKYSILLFQIIIGLITMAVTNSPNFTNKIILIAYVVVATLSTLFLAVVWKNKINDLGPVEFIVKRIAGSTKKS